MKVALIIPAWLPEDIFPKKTAGSQLNYWQPLGVLYLAANLKKSGHDVLFLNGAFLNQSEIIKQTYQYNPDLVGLYSTTFGWSKATHFAKLVKQSLPNAFICVGGPYPTVIKDKCLKQCFSIDAVIVGEAEIAIVQLANCLQNRETLDNILGLVFRRHDAIHINSARPLNENLDFLPFPARELLEDKFEYLPAPSSYRRKPVALVLTSRGCNRRCIFCSQMDKSRKYGQRGIRFRSVQNVIDEIETCLDQGYREIKFIDDTLAADYDRLKLLCETIIEKRLDFTWFASACANQVDKPLLKLMKQAGCWAILFGVESGVQRNLNTLKKGITLAQVETAVALAKSVGIVVTTSFMFGIPGETYKDGLKTIKFACKIQPDYANFHALTPFPGTYLYDHIEKYGNATKNLEKYNYQGAAFVPFSMTQQEIQALRQRALRTFYSHPKVIWNHLMHIRNWNALVATIKGAKSMFWLCASKKVFVSDLRYEKTGKG